MSGLGGRDWESGGGKGDLLIFGAMNDQHPKASRSPPPPLAALLGCRCQSGDLRHCRTSGRPVDSSRWSLHSSFPVVLACLPPKPLSCLPRPARRASLFVVSWQELAGKTSRPAAGPTHRPWTFSCQCGVSCQLETAVELSQPPIGFACWLAVFGHNWPGDEAHRRFEGARELQLRISAKPERYHKVAPSILCLELLATCYDLHQELPLYPSPCLHSIDRQARLTCMVPLRGSSQ